MTRGQSDIKKGNKLKTKVDWLFNGCDDGFMDLYKCYQSVYFNYVHFTASIFRLLKLKNIFKIQIWISYCLNKIPDIDYTTFCLMLWEGQLASVVKNISNKDCSQSDSTGILSQCLLFTEGYPFSLSSFFYLHRNGLEEDSSERLQKPQNFQIIFSCNALC